jgi:hypothetical protein
VQHFAKRCRPRSFAAACCAAALACALHTGCSHPPSVVVPPGANLEEVAALVEGAGIAPAPAFLARAKDAVAARALGVSAGTLEGYLAAGTYTLQREQGLDGLLSAMVGPQRAALTEALRASQKGDVQERELLILASMVEKEAPLASERPLVASVLYNRWRAGWHLASDATLAAALHHKDGSLSRKERVTDHPFNTFVRLGLPPEPLCSPSREAIGAVLAPHSDALVMFHDPAGRHSERLADDERAALAAIPFDPPPPEITRGIHYFVSNEHKPYYTRDALLESGGVIIGVGSDQNYLYAGWGRPDLLVAMDFDGMIADLHGAYRVAFLSSPTPADFAALWTTKSQRHFEELIKKAYEEPERTAVLTAYRWALSRVIKRMERVREAFASQKMATYLTDPEQYAQVVALYRDERVVRLRGDLTAHDTLRQLGAVLTRFHRPVGLLYVSNAEQYFDYGADYRANITSLPADGDALVLHTWTTGNGYNYIVQGLGNFQKWLAEPAVRKADDMWPPLKHEQPLVEFNDLPKVATKEPK